MLLISALAVAQDDAVIKVDVDLVNVLCTVRGKNGGLIGNLEKKDFQIFEDGKQQEIKYFTRETDVPLTIGLLVDTSGSQERLIEVERRAAHQFFTQVLRKKDLAFLISFLVIAAMWSEHHHVFRYAARSDAWLRSLDMVWLMMVVLNPFATKLLTSEGPDTPGTHALRWGFYALLQILASATFLAMVHHMLSHDLQAADTPSSLVSDAGWRSYGVLLGFGLSIPLFLVVRWAWVLWIACPLLVGQVYRYRRRHRLATSVTD